MDAKHVDIKQDNSGVGGSWQQVSLMIKMHLSASGKSRHFFSKQHTG